MTLSPLLRASVIAGGGEDELVGDGLLDDELADDGLVGDGLVDDELVGDGLVDDELVGGGLLLVQLSRVRAARIEAPASVPLLATIEKAIRDMMTPPSVRLAPLACRSYGAHS
jgi:hypothetical protein